MTRLPSISATLLLLIVLAALLPSSQAFSMDIDWDTVVIIDVRSKAEWNESRLEGSIWIPWTQIEQGVTLQQISSDQQLAFYCEAGIRADRAIRRLNRLGFANTINLISLEQASITTGRNILK